MTIAFHNATSTQTYVPADTAQRVCIISMPSFCLIHSSTAFSSAPICQDKPLVPGKNTSHTQKSVVQTAYALVCLQCWVDFAQKMYILDHFHYTDGYSEAALLHCSVYVHTPREGLRTVFFSAKYSSQGQFPSAPLNWCQNPSLSCCFMWDSFICELIIPLSLSSQSLTVLGFAV